MSSPQVSDPAGRRPLPHRLPGYPLNPDSRELRAAWGQGIASDGIRHYADRRLQQPRGSPMSTSAHPRAEPESVGLSSARLRRIGEALRRDIEAAQLPGAVVGIMRAGKLAHLEAVGARDPATGD